MQRCRQKRGQNKHRLNLISIPKLFKRMKTSAFESAPVSFYRATKPASGDTFTKKVWGERRMISGPGAEE